MSHFPDVPHPLQLDDVGRDRASAGEIRLRLSGRWLAATPPAESGEALLVVQIDGRRHRFAPDGEAQTPSPGRWRASFLLPGWAEPRREGQAALWIGDAVIPVPPAGIARRDPGTGPPALGSAVAADEPVPPGVPMAPAPAASPTAPSAPGDEPLSPPAAVPPSAHDWSAAASGLTETPRSGPLADVLLKETVAALHGELEARAAEAVRLRSALTSAQSDLESRGHSQGELEGTLGELGTELRRLMESVAQQRAELEAAGVEAAAARDRHAGEIVALREQHAAALTAQREEHTAALAALAEDHAAAIAALRGEQQGHTGELQARLAAAEESARRRSADAAALREELAGAQVAREAARGESAGLQSELQRLGLELASTRERVDAESGDLGEANRLLADARALADQLRGRSSD